ncbi:hypothetical protein [Streptomyces flavofungini]|uniref:Secreted protein n=1 Tax=Streptomyces flavofungini TaxID=68200 RepID=A0ABS0X1E7_9ACTN|nr:hypothetical protein [Streptomyces flavofungini]MBJ3806881.1 hypothetical protein [Streptomyces flavofungini]GHC59949.1 hypothetical protein GCM10010349_28930 [Streptomyces flavofungini]
MRTGLRITAYAAAVAAAFTAAYGVGTNVDTVSKPAAHSEKSEGGHGKEGGGHDEPPGGEAGGAAPAGLQVSADGYALDLKTPRARAGERTDLRFTVLKESSGAPLKTYKKEHGKELHLILASRDLTTYRHLHPARAADGTWSVPATLPKAGDYRVFADFTPRGADAKVTLGTDLAVTGPYAPGKLPPATATAKAPDGYEVRLTGGLTPGKPREVTLRVTRDGKPVTDLQPYLGAYGHLVALRAGDLAYLHVHPNGEPGDGTTEPGPEVSFTATAPSAGAYRLFLDFRHEGVVRTAAFTVRTGGAAQPSAGETESPHEEQPHGH